MIMLRIILGTEPLAEKRRSSRNRLKNKRGDRSMDSDHSPEIPDGGNASVKQNIPSLPSGLETKEVHRTVQVLNPSTKVWTLNRLPELQIRGQVSRTNFMNIYQKKKKKKQQENRKPEKGSRWQRLRCAGAYKIYDEISITNGKMYAN